MIESKTAKKTPLPEEIENFGKHYNDLTFQKKLKLLPISALKKILGKALLLRELLFSRDTPLWARGIILGALGYLILPLDVVPDFLPGVGFLDDITVMGLVLANLDNLVTADIRQRVDQRLKNFPKTSSDEATAT